jgi:hypothetical protein
MLRISPSKPKMRTSSALRHTPSGDGPPRPTPQSDRFAALETAVTSIQRTLDVQFQRIAAIQAELDHLTAKKNQNS